LFLAARHRAEQALGDPRYLRHSLTRRQSWGPPSNGRSWPRGTVRPIC
jgi:hypothetical protein